MFLSYRKKHFYFLQCIIQSTGFRCKITDFLHLFGLKLIPDKIGQFWFFLWTAKTHSHKQNGNTLINAIVTVCKISKGGCGKTVVLSLKGWFEGVVGGGVGRRANGPYRYEREVVRWDRQA